MHRVEYLLWLKHMGLSSQEKLVRALELFTSPEELAGASDEELAECGIFSEKELSYLKQKDMRFVEEEIARCNESHTYLVDYYSKYYPDRLRNIPSPPLLLYVRGSREALLTPAVAVVGTRTADSYGITTAQDIGENIARVKKTVVSGMAQGIDQAALRAASAHGCAIGVLCCGMDVDYPTDSASLREAIIASGGAIITEFEFGVTARSGYFPMRNRIMAALSETTVVVQAGGESGALVTAELAARYGRKVFAVPGRIDTPASAGCHELIKNGAAILTDPVAFALSLNEPDAAKTAAMKSALRTDEIRFAEDIDRRGELHSPAASHKQRDDSAESAPTMPAVSPGNTESDNMVALYELLRETPLSAAELAAKSGRTIKWVMSTLIIAEVSGKVREISGGRYELIQ